MADIFATIITTNLFNLSNKLFFNIVKICIKSDIRVQYLFQKQHLTEIGDIVNERQKIFGTSIGFIWKRSAYISVN
jgi:hypothetical protein